MTVEPQRSVHISNLPVYPLNELEELLYELFLQAGPVSRVFIPYDKQGEHRGYGFVEFIHEVSVPYACKLMHGIRLLGMYIGVNLVPVKIQKKDEDQMDEENTSDNTMPPLENIVEQPSSSLSFSISVPTTLATLSNSLSKPPSRPLLMNTPPLIFPPFPPPCIPQDVFPCPPFPPPIFTPPQIPLLPPPPPSLPLHAVSFNTTCNITPLFSLPHPTTVISSNSTPPISLFSNNVHALPLPTPLNNIHHSVTLPLPTPPLNNIHHSVPLPCPTPPLLPPAYFSFSCDDNQVTEDVIISDEGKLKVEINKDDIENEREDETGFIEVFDYHHCPPINTPSLPPLNI